MFAFIDSGGAHTSGTTYHPLNGYTGTVQDQTAYASNGKNVTGAAGKVVINQIIQLSAPSATTYTYSIRSTDDLVAILSGTTGGNAGLGRPLLVAPIEIDRPVAFRFTGIGQFLIDYDIAQI